MSDRMDAVLANIDEALAECICGNPIPADGPSLDYCSPACQRSYITGEAVTEPYPYPVAAATDGRTINEEVNRRFEPGAYTDDPFDGLMRGITEATRHLQIPDTRNAATFQRPVDRYTMSRASYHNPPGSFAAEMDRIGTAVSEIGAELRRALEQREQQWREAQREATRFYWCPNAELADGVDLTPYLVGFDGAHPGTVYCAPVTNPDAGIPIGVIRPDGNVITERLPLPGPEPEPTPEEFRRRALEARHNRNTGPQRRDNRRWRNT